MQALDSLVKTNKVLYLGISDTPGTSIGLPYLFVVSYPCVINARSLDSCEGERLRPRARDGSIRRLCVAFSGIVPLESPHIRSADQGAWNLKERDLEREIVPMCRAEGMGIVPWGVLGQVCEPPDLIFIALTIFVYPGQIQD